MMSAQFSKPKTLSPLGSAFVRWLTFPAAMSIFAVAVAAIHRQWLPRPELVQMLAFAATALLVMSAERLLPFRADWAAVPSEEKRTDRTSLLALFVFVDPLLKLVAIPALASLGLAALPPLGRPGLFPSDLPLAGQLSVAIVCADFGGYWMHRLAHRLPVLWGAHSFHHNPARLYWLNGFRVNPLNIAWHQLSSVFVLNMLGAPLEVVQMVVTLGVVIAVMQHCNADLRYDGWNLLLGTADLHRWHHSLKDGEHSSNYGALTALWDRVFGTYKRGHAGPEQVGISGDMPSNEGYLREVWQAYARHSSSPREVRTRAAQPLPAIELQHSLCSSCPLPRGRSLSLAQRLRSWIPCSVSGCCAGD